jgi:hypothetical protein
MTSITPACQDGGAREWLEGGRALRVASHHLREIESFASSWLWAYNHDRLNIAAGGITAKIKIAPRARPVFF